MSAYKYKNTLELIVHGDWKPEAENVENHGKTSEISSTGLYLLYNAASFK